MAVYDREEDAPQVNLYGRKMKLLEVMRILERETDAEHALTANRIAARLEEKGFPHADRKGIYDDINVLNCFLKPGGGGSSDNQKSALLQKHTHSGAAKRVNTAVQRGTDAVYRRAFGRRCR